MLSCNLIYPGNFNEFLMLMQNQVAKQDFWSVVNIRYVPLQVNLSFFIRIINRKEFLLNSENKLSLY